jgi:hypothetical protein
MMTFEEALELIGEIKPRYLPDYKRWVFESPHFPFMEIEGDTEADVLRLYPHFLKEHIDDLNAGRVAEFIVKATPGWGGKRHGAGRPRAMQASVRKRIPADIAAWLDQHGYDRLREWIQETG